MVRTSRLGRIVVLATLTLFAAAGPMAARSPDANLAVASSAAQASAADTLEDELLTAADLPDGFQTDGMVDGSGFNIDDDAFAANGGARIVSQVWNRDAPDASVTVFDFRMAFPSAEDAAAYLDDAEAIISERNTSGLDHVADAPTIGENHRLYSGSSDIAGTTLSFHNHLFTVGPVAAKVFVSSVGEGGEETAAAIAQSAADRMAAVQSGGVATPSDPPASTSPDFAEIFEAILMAHVPDGISDCQTERTPAFDGELAGIVCPIGDAGELLVMRQLDSADSLSAAFTTYATSPASDEGTCGSAAALEPRVAEGDRVGQLVCYDATDGTRIFMWTDERFDILSWITSDQQRSFEELFRQYLSAGPVAGQEPSGTPEPTTAPDGSGAPLTDLEAELLTHVPSAFRDGCAPTDFKAPTSNAALGCSIPLGTGSLTLTYQSYDDAEAMDTAYSANLSFMQVERETGPCSGDWPGETTYTIGGEPAGRVGCAQFSDAAQFMTWTDDRLLIHVYAEGFGVGKDDLYQWWLDDSGPVS